MNSQIFEGYSEVGGTGGKGIVIFFDRAQRSTYVVAKFELARCFVEKVGQSQRLCNCVNNQFFRAAQGWEGRMGRGFVNIFS